MCDGMVAFQTRALSSSSTLSLAHRLAASALLLLFTLLPHGHASGKTHSFSQRLLLRDTRRLNRHLLEWIDQGFFYLAGQIKLASFTLGSVTMLPGSSIPLILSLFCLNDSQHNRVLMSAVTLLS